MFQGVDTVFLEPGEVELIARALQVEARARLALGGDSAIRGLAVRELRRAFEALLLAERPPLYVLQRASADQAQAYVRHLVDG